MKQQHSHTNATTLERLNEVGRTMSKDAVVKAAETFDPLKMLFKEKQKGPGTNKNIFKGHERRSGFDRRANTELFNAFQNIEKDRSELEYRKKIAELTLENKKLVEAVNKLSNVTGLEKAVINNNFSSSKKYDIAFLDFLIETFRTLSAKVNDAMTWVNVSEGRKNKRKGLLKTKQKASTKFDDAQEHYLSRQHGM